jgi:hypothetical protein
MTLYELYKYTPKEIVEVEYLLDQAKRFDILDEVQEAFFQFSPALVEEHIEGFGEHEPWAISHKRHIVNEIIYYLIDKICENEYIAEYWINEQIFKEIFTPFMLKNDFRKLDDEKIFKLFKTYLEENFVI